MDAKRLLSRCEDRKEGKNDTGIPYSTYIPGLGGYFGPGSGADETDCYERAHDADEGKLIEFVFTPLRCEFILLFGICAIEKNHDGGVSGVRWCNETAAEYFQDGMEDACLRIIKSCLLHPPGQLVVLTWLSTFLAFFIPLPVDRDTSSALPRSGASAIMVLLRFLGD